MEKIKLEQFKNGMTVKDLKRIVKDIPENNYYGYPYEVWIGNINGTSNVVHEICPLNPDKHGSDIILKCLGEI